MVNSATISLLVNKANRHDSLLNSHIDLVLAHTFGGYNDYGEFQNN